MLSHQRPLIRWHIQHASQNEDRRHAVLAAPSQPRQHIETGFRFGEINVQDKRVNHGVFGDPDHLGHGGGLESVESAEA